MSKSSPADLAVAFRSLQRRLGEATNDDTPPPAIVSAQASVNAAIAGAAAVLGSAPSADAVAARIADRHASDWTDEDLRAIQFHADEAARAIRALASLAEVE